jgi:DNA mismatch repair protein MutS2
MNFKTAININTQLKAIYELMDIKTFMGKNMLFNSKFSKDKNLLEKQYSMIEDCINFLRTLNEKDLHKFECTLNDTHNIKNSISIIKGGNILDDVGLFEVKSFCLNCKTLNFILKDLKNDNFLLASCQEIINILDPEGLEIKQFYIYSAYNKELTEKRNIFEKYKLEENPETDKIYAELIDIENKVREKLCQSIVPFLDTLTKNLDTIALIDICFAKAQLAINLNLVKPNISDKISLNYTKIFNPIIKKTLNAIEKDFQAIDISLNEKTTLITGANMAGKTVTLKTLALSQYLIQFGFFAPCEKCEVFLFEDILTSIGDNQNTDEGLSSFASEILNLNNIIKKVKAKNSYLVLVDELARTTNPIEGVKLLNGFISTLSIGKSLSIITTHYSNIKSPCHHLRVKGFTKKEISSTVDIKNLSNYIDYSLVEDTSNTTPNEAINLCKMLGVDSSWLDNCQ